MGRAIRRWAGLEAGKTLRGAGLACVAGRGYFCRKSV
jgi:hypothetical protein